MADEPVRPIGDPPRASDDTAAPAHPTRASTIPRPLDALGRDLLALRALAGAFIATGEAMLATVDAALTNYRTATLAEQGRDVAITGEQLDERSLEHVAERIRDAAGLSKTPGRPKFFGDRVPGGAHGRTDSTDAPGSGDALRVPPIGSELPPS